MNALKYAPQGKIRAVKYPAGKPQSKTVKPEAKTAYKAPKIGEFGIQAADTSYYVSNNNIAQISYYTDKEKKHLSQCANYNSKTGKLNDYTVFLDNRTFSVKKGCK